MKKLKLFTNDTNTSFTIAWYSKFQEMQLKSFKTKQMVNTNFSNETTNQLLTEYQFRVEALQNKIEELKAILEVNNLI